MIILENCKEKTLKLNKPSYKINLDQSHCEWSYGDNKFLMAGNRGHGPGRCDNIFAQKHSLVLALKISSFHGFDFCWRFRRFWTLFRYLNKTRCKLIFLESLVAKKLMRPDLETNKLVKKSFYWCFLLENNNFYCVSLSLLKSKGFISSYALFLLKHWFS